MHSHLIPAVDDGSTSTEDSIALIKGLMDLGYERAITTPHIMADFYRNEPDELREKCKELNKVLIEREINFPVEVAAEYYLDENFDEQTRKKNLISFGGDRKYVLVEMSFLSQSNNLTQLIFNAKVHGYQPILAHPERYQFLYTNFEFYKDLFQGDLLFQINLASFVGYYSKEAQKIAERLVKEKMVHFIGTDLHNVRHFPSLRAAMQTKAFQELKELPLRNNSL